MKIQLCFLETSYSSKYMDTFSSFREFLPLLQRETAFYDFLLSSLDDEALLNLGLKDNFDPRATHFSV